MMIFGCFFGHKWSEWGRSIIKTDDGRLWADGKAHYPTYKGPTNSCGACRGSGTTAANSQEISKDALSEYEREGKA